jgi:TM2 domain-containing membrane protein YozV
MEKSFCMNCGKELTLEDDFCPECGTKKEFAVEPVKNEVIYQEKSVELKNPYVASGLSVISGVGQIYNGQTHKGLFYLASFFICLVLSSFYIMFLILIVVWFYAIYDAYITAKKINAGEIVEDKIF